jgi:hypothetical protein
VSVVADYRKLLLDIASEALDLGPGFAQEGYVLGEVRRKLNLRENLKGEQQVLDAWHDLFKQGELAWGYDLTNPQSPFFHKPA